MLEIERPWILGYLIDRFIEYQKELFHKFVSFFAGNDDMQSNEYWMTTIGIILVGLVLIMMAVGCGGSPAEVREVRQVESKSFFEYEGMAVYAPAGWPDVDALLARVFPMSGTTVDLTMWKEGEFKKTGVSWHIVFLVEHKELSKVLFYYKTNYEKKTVIVYDAEDNKPDSRISLEEMQLRLKKIWEQEDKEGV